MFRSSLQHGFIQLYGHESSNQERASTENDDSIARKTILLKTTDTLADFSRLSQCLYTSVLSSHFLPPEEESYHDTDCHKTRSKKKRKGVTLLEFALVFRRQGDGR